MYLDLQFYCHIGVQNTGTVSHLFTDYVNLVLHLGDPLTDDSKQLRDGGAGIHQNLQTGWVIRIKECEG